MSFERAIPVFRYTLVSGGSSVVDDGTADVVAVTPQAPRLAFDVRVGDHVTVGAAASVGYVRTSSSSAKLVPDSTAPLTVAWAFAPRVGMYLPLSPAFAFWPRLGATYVDARISRNGLNDLPATHLGVDLDAFAVFSPVDGVGFLFGPGLELPVSGARSVPVNDAGATVKTKSKGESITTLAFTAGLVVSLP